MGNRRRIQRLTASLALAGAFSYTNAQEQTTGINFSPTQSVSSSNEATATPSRSEPESSLTDVPLQLWGIANSLLSSYYPSTTISNVASLTWPSVVVIDSSTYTRNPPKTSPSTSPSTLATAVISSQDVSRPVTTDSTTANDAEPSDNPEEPATGKPKDRTLGIALGVVFGVLALGLMAFALLCVHHRQKKHGGTGLFPSRRRRATSPTDSEIGAWRARHPHMGLVAATVAAGGRPMSQVDDNRPPREWVDRYNRLEDHQTPPAHLHPAFMHRHSDSGGGLSESNPFFPPADHQSPQQTAGLTRYNESNDYHPGYPKPGFNVTTSPYNPYRSEEARRSQSSHNRHRRSSISSSRSDDDLDLDLERNSRPPTPFSPMMMLQTSLPPQQQQQPNPTNPFTSTEDEYETHPNPHPQPHSQQTPNHLPPRDLHEHELYYGEEDDDIVSPMLQEQQHQQQQQPPSKSPARRYSPLVHYPSWSEVSEFDFTGESPPPQNGLRQQQQQQSGRRSSVRLGEDDGYGRDRESVVGRTELA